MYYLRSCCRGAAALSTILLIGGIIVETAAAGLLASYLVSQEGLGLKLSNDATLISRAGVDDALLSIMRNGEDASARNYQITIGTWNTQVAVEKAVLLTDDTQFTITSIATVLNKKSATQAIIIVDNISGLAQIESIDDIAP